SNDGGDRGDAGLAARLCPGGCGSEPMCAGLCVSRDDPWHGCGTCVPCDLPHARPSCAQGACVIAACEPGWADCDHDPSNGCEADLSSPTTCGACNVACGGAANLCSPTGCVATCSPPLTTCGSSCADLSQSASHCGGCRACDRPSRGFPVCSGGSCAAPSCFGGLTACNGACVDTTSDGQHCGACGHGCPAVNRAVGLCANSVCTGVCQPGWTLCSTGCVTTQTD